MTEIVFKEESYIIIGICIRVYEELGGGFLENVYEKALEKEFNSSGVPYDKQVKLNIKYKGENLDKYYVADFVVYDKIILEVKAVYGIINQHGYVQLSVSFHCRPNLSGYIVANIFNT